MLARFFPLLKAEGWEWFPVWRKEINKSLLNFYWGTSALSSNFKMLKLKIPSNSSQAGGDKSHHSSRICIPLFFAIWTGPIILAARIHTLLCIDLLPTPSVSISVYLPHLALSQIERSYFRNTHYGTLYRICASKFIPRTIMFQNENVNFRFRQSITGNRHAVLAYLEKKCYYKSETWPELSGLKSGTIQNSK